MHIDKCKLCNIENEESKDVVVNILNTYLEDILQDDEVTLESAITNNFIIGNSYLLLKNKDIFNDKLLSNMNIIRTNIIDNNLGNTLTIDHLLLDAAFSTYVIYKSTNYFEKFVYSLNDYVVQQVDKCIQFYNDRCTDIGYEMFSLSTGLLGICNYLLEFNSKYEKSIKSILEIIIDITIDNRSSYARIKNLVDTNNNKIDFSLCNGITGLLFILTKSKSKGIVIKYQDLAINRISNYLKMCEDENEMGVFWPASLTVGINYKIDNPIDMKDQVNIKETLGYGALSISNTMHCLYKYNGNDILQEYYFKIALSKIKIPVKDYILGDASVLLGYSGLLCLFDNMNTKWNDIRFIKKNNDILESILSLYKNSGKIGFYKCEIINKSDRIYEYSKANDNSIRNGNSGIILAFISAFTMSDKLFYNYLGIS